LKRLQRGPDAFLVSDPPVVKGEVGRHCVVPAGTQVCDERLPAVGVMPGAMQQTERRHGGHCLPPRGCRECRPLEVPAPACLPLDTLRRTTDAQRLTPCETATVHVRSPFRSCLLSYVAAGEGFVGHG